MVNGGPAAGIWKDITALVLGPMLLVGFYFRTFFLSRGGALYGNDADPSFINAIHAIPLSSRSPSSKPT